jgi:beta-mannosidase
MQVRTSDFAQFLHIDDPCFQPEDDWLHLPPGQTRRIALHPRGAPDAVPAGAVTALNADRIVRYAGRA